MPVRAYSKASRFSSSPLAPTFQRHVLRDKHDEVGCLIVADKSQALQRCVMILRSRDSEEYAVASTGLLSATTKQRRRTVHARLSVVIATALALGSTSAVLAESNGDGGAFDAGSFHGVAWAVEVFRRWLGWWRFPSTWFPGERVQRLCRSPRHWIRSVFTPSRRLRRRSVLACR
jgi:hypothetical protein